MHFFSLTDSAPYLLIFFDFSYPRGLVGYFSVCIGSFSHRLDGLVEGVIYLNLANAFIA